MCCLGGGKKTKVFLTEALSAFMGQKRRTDAYRRGASGNEVEEGRNAEGVVEEKKEETEGHRIFFFLKMSDGEGWRVSCGQGRIT